MSTFIPFPKFDAGVSNAGAQLFTYIAGTTTKQTTQTTPAGDVDNANPVVLDSLGQGNVLPTAGLSYKYVLAPSTDTDPPTSPIWTVDNISSPASGTSFTIVNTKAALKALASGAFNVVQTLGYTTVGDGGHAEYRWNATDTAADDAGRTLQPDSAPGTGRWNMLDTGYINDLSLNGTGDLEITSANDKDIVLTSYASAGNLGEVGIHGDAAVTIDVQSGNIILDGASDIFLKSGAVTQVTLDGTTITCAKPFVVTGNSSFTPRILSQDGEPAAGTGATQIATSEMLIWVDTNDLNRTYLVFNRATNVVKLELT